MSKSQVSFNAPEAMGPKESSSKKRKVSEDPSEHDDPTRYIITFHATRYTEHLEVERTVTLGGNLGCVIRGQEDARAAFENIRESIVRSTLWVAEPEVRTGEPGLVVQEIRFTVKEWVGRDMSPTLHHMGSLKMLSLPEMSRKDAEEKKWVDVHDPAFQGGHPPWPW